MTVQQKAILTGKKCPYCGNASEYVSGASIYNGRFSDRMFYVCWTCDARIGTHKHKPEKALGSLANGRLRKRRMLAHKYFDPIWKAVQAKYNVPKHVARNTTYKWLASELELDVKYCHIGMFDLEMCDKVINLCKTYVS